MQRQTLSQSIHFSGVGVHGGVDASVVVAPAHSGEGIALQRTDMADKPRFPATIDFVSRADHATTLAADGNAHASVSTVEHLMAALYAAGVDDAEIAVDGPELPVLDGSAAPFFAAIEAVGLAPSHGEVRTIVLHEPIEVGSGTRRVVAMPADHFGLDVEIDFPHPAVGIQRIELPEFSASVFRERVAPARTFGFLAEVEALRAAGLARGGSLDNTIVLDEGAVMNPEGLRFEDEFVRHKALDLVGDLALLGSRLQAQVVAVRGGHALHHELVRAILDNPGSWSFAL